jgi:hypothetical protein
VVTAWLRPGNPSDANIIENVLSEVLAPLEPRHHVGQVRGDCGFGIGTLLAKEH